MTKEKHNDPSTSGQIIEQEMKTSSQNSIDDDQSDRSISQQQQEPENSHVGQNHTEEDSSQDAEINYDDTSIQSLSTSASQETFHTVGEIGHLLPVEEDKKEIDTFIECEKEKDFDGGKFYTSSKKRRMKNGYHSYQIQTQQDNDILRTVVGDDELHQQTSEHSLHEEGPISGDASVNSIPCSPVRNELRQRHVSTPDGNIISNRVRSYTSPDSSFDRQAGFLERHSQPRSELISFYSFRRWLASHSPSLGSRTSRAAQIAQTQIESIEDSNHEISSNMNNNGRSGGQHSILYPQTIQEESEIIAPIRQRANSEPERSRWMNFYRERHILTAGIDPSSPQALDIISSVDSLESGGNSLPFDRISSGNSSSERLSRTNFMARDGSRVDPSQDPHEIELQNRTHNGQIELSTHSTTDVNHDPYREARRNWVRITRRFHVLLIIVGTIFSFILLSIMVTWVVLMSAYVVSIDDVCDLPLKPYFWLATVQMLLDVFRKEIMKQVFRFDPNRQEHQNIPTRVVCYNIAYITYALLVLRMGVLNIFSSEDSECPHTAKKLFNTTRVFVCMTMAAWFVVLFGYFIPFTIVAYQLTRNGYSPAAELNEDERQRFGVFPLPNRNRAPSNCIEKLHTIEFSDFREDFPRECCVRRIYLLELDLLSLHRDSPTIFAPHTNKQICMSDFSTREKIVVTECEHVFHYGCCDEWMKQARTCPVCRTDIPESLGIDNEANDEESSNARYYVRGFLFARAPFRSNQFQEDLVTLVSLLRENNVRR